MPNQYMDNKRKAIMFAVLAAIVAASTSSLDSNPTINHVYLVLPWILIAGLLFLAGFYVGLNRNQK